MILSPCLTTSVIGHPGQPQIVPTRVTARPDEQLALNMRECWNCTQSCGPRTTGEGRAARTASMRERMATRSLGYRVFGGFYRSSPDDLPSWFCLEDRWLLGERIDAFPRLCGGLFDDNKLGKSGHKEGPGFLEFPIANFRDRLDDALHVFSSYFVRMLLNDFLDEFRLRYRLRQSGLLCVPNEAPP